MNPAHSPYQPSLSGQHHREIGNLDYRLQLEIWKGNLAGALEMATTSKQLTDWLVALSPLGNTLFSAMLLRVMKELYLSGFLVFLL